MAVLVSSILLSNQASAQFGLGPFEATETIAPTYVVDIVAGSAQKDSNLGYVPSDISIPVGNKRVKQQILKLKYINHS